MTDPTQRRVLPTGAPDRLDIDGILEGRVGDDVALRAALTGLDRCGFGKFQCEFTGGRFSLLPRDTELPGQGLDGAAQARFLDQLGAVVAAAVVGSVESTLRCRMTFPDQVVDTLFAVRGGAIEPLSRQMPRAPGERAHAAGQPPAMPFGLRRREALLFGPILLLVGVFLAWQSGLVDRVLAARAESLTVATGPFAQMLRLQVVRSWGRYEISIQRGATFPADPRALAALREGAGSLSERAACEAVGDGGTVWVQLRNHDGRVLDAVRVELRALLADDQTPVETQLSGRIGAAAITLSLTRDAPQGK